MIAHLYETLRAAATGGNSYIIVGLAFIAGILTSFTPCLYPMIPITIGILQAQALPSVWSNFLMALSYVVGMATVYASLGYLAAASSIIFGQWMANPWFIVIAIIIFLYLALSMFGLYELYMPSFLTKHHEISPGRSLLRSFVFGIFSGTVASPCLTPPLAILLTFVAKRANPFLGVAALFAFALGMGMLLLAIGTFSSSLAILPRTGRWMLEVKRFFGFVMIAMCVYLARTVIGETWAMYLYGGVAAAMAVYYLIALIKQQ